MSEPTASHGPLTAADICAALHRRYNRPSQGRPGEQYVCIEEARAGAGFDGNQGRCDFLAINTWPSRGLELIGHEIKVTVSDWHAELAHPDKAERFARYCQRWFLVVPAALAPRIVGEVPADWGLMVVSTNGRLATVRTGQQREPEPVPAWWWVGWLAQIDRQHKRRLPALIEAPIAASRDPGDAVEPAQLSLLASQHPPMGHDIPAGRPSALTGATTAGIDSGGDLGLEQRP